MSKSLIEQNCEYYDNVTQNYGSYARTSCNENTASFVIITDRWGPREAVEAALNTLFYIQRDVCSVNDTVSEIKDKLNNPD